MQLVSPTAIIVSERGVIKNMLLSTLISLNLRKIKAERNSKMQMWTKMCGGGKLMN